VVEGARVALNLDLLHCYALSLSHSHARDSSLPEGAFGLDCFGFRVVGAPTPTKYDGNPHQAVGAIHESPAKQNII